ncbi:YtxH domain-containing protein [Tumebacillus flagellatus]|uniref:Uncharacterized protein n=1 Tax=Tumebacillus flagellatus TaxID=1157490 RepID=A0A074LM83_9BACL|nr:YtxH domain-containing protein [Tumebacillus flagellatus]KEO82219.1 hypothetical protein EL26_16340 [Tumebacillus flagellatus]
MKFRLNSPVGIALTVAGVVLALSPEARKATRRLLVKGTASLLGAVDGVKQSAVDVTDTAAESASNTTRYLADSAENIGDTVADTAWNNTESVSDAAPH